MSDQKQVIVINSNLDMSRGKMAAQASHASLGAYKKASSDELKKWESQGQKKVVLSSGDRKMEDLYESAKRNNLPAFLVKDAGYTELSPGTKTALGIGPSEESKVDKITGQLELIK